MGLGECRKFVPNIFNKQKCSNCYKLKLQHSEAALEVAKTARNVARCGYLFVAPDWDFTNPIYRTKRWQRRWFVLFDDGELTYSIDDHPETVPFCVIDMNTVFEITAADGITGNPNSIAIVAPDGIHFIKGSCPEESRLWLDILKLFSQCSTNIRKEGGTGSRGRRANRSATFPGIRNIGVSFRESKKKLSTVENESELHDGEADEPEGDTLHHREEEIVDAPAPLYSNSSHNRTAQSTPLEAEDEDEAEDEEEQEEEDEDEEEDDDGEEEEEESSTDEARSEESNGNSAEDSMEEYSRYTSFIKTSRLSSNQFSSETLSSGQSRVSSLSSIGKSISKSLLYGNHGLTSSSPSTPSRASPSRSTSSQSREGSAELDWHERSPRGKRGVPDGGNLILDTPFDLNVKKGWLMKESARGASKEWHKYWFVLQDGALMYYRDPLAESNGFLDGVIALNLVEEVNLEDVERNFGFRLRTMEPRTHRLSAVTAGIRIKWIDAIKSATTATGCSGSHSPSISSRSTGKADTIDEEIKDVDASFSPSASTAAFVGKESTGNGSPGNTTSRPARRGDSFTALSTLASSYSSSNSRSSSYTTKANESLEESLGKGKISSDGGTGRIPQRTAASTTSAAALRKEISHIRSKSSVDLSHNIRLPRSAEVKEYAQEEAQQPSPKCAPNLSEWQKRVSDLEKSQCQLEKELKSAREHLVKVRAEADEFRDCLYKEKANTAQIQRELETSEKRTSDLIKEKKLESDKMVTIMQDNSQLKQSMSEHIKNSDKWKAKYQDLVYDSEDLQARLLMYERENERRSSTMGEQLLSKDQIIADLSEQLKESEERIHDLLADMDTSKDERQELQQAHEEEMTRLIMAVESKFNEDRALKKEAAAQVSTRGTELEDESARILPIPEAIGSTPEAFSELCSRLQAAIDEIDHLKRSLRERQGSIDKLDVEKMCLEQAFKRTILMHEEQEKLLVERVQDLTNKLYSSEKSLRQIKERRASRQQKLKEKQHQHSSASN